MGRLRKARIYDPKSGEDGARILVDRLWPRGVKKEEADLEEWAKDIAPSAELRRAYHRAEITGDEFQRRYRRELKDNKQTEAFAAKVGSLLRAGNVTLLSAAADLSAGHVPLLEAFLGERLSEQAFDTDAAAV